MLSRLERMHRSSDFHGAVCPDAVRIGPKGARLEPPGRIPAPPEYRDPERERGTMKDARVAYRAEPRSDVYGAGALLFTLLDGGPPPCGAASRLTRPTPPAAAFIAARAMAEGAARYPSAAAMKGDVDRLIRLAKSRPLSDVEPESLPSYWGGPAPTPKRLVPFAVRETREKRVRPWRRLLAFALLLAAVAGYVWHEYPASPGSPATPAEAAAARPADLPSLLAKWRARIDDRLKFTGGKLDPVGVPLVVVATVAVPKDLGWPVHPSRSKTAEVARLLARGTTAADLDPALLRIFPGETLPAVLEVTAGPGRGVLTARLLYRGLEFADRVPAR